MSLIFILSMHYLLYILYSKFSKLNTSKADPGNECHIRKGTKICYHIFLEALSKNWFKWVL